tara:strand:+ start:300 stop:587 length:288 start_codon:yes stop_codon:yes gene_type:complete
MHDDRVLCGLFKAETDTNLTLREQGKKLQVFKKSALKTIQRPVSGMPAMNYMRAKRRYGMQLYFWARSKAKTTKQKCHINFKSQPSSTYNYVNQR